MRATAVDARGSVRAVMEDSLVDVTSAMASSSDNDDVIGRLGDVEMDTLYTPKAQKDITIQLLYWMAKDIGEGYYNENNDNPQFDASESIIALRMALHLNHIIDGGPFWRAPYRWRSIPNFMSRSSLLFPLDAAFVISSDKKVAGKESKDRALKLEVALAMPSPRRDLFSGQIVRILPEDPLHCVVGFIVRLLIISSNEIALMITFSLFLLAVARKWQGRSSLYGLRLDCRHIARYGMLSLPFTIPSAPSDSITLQTLNTVKTITNFEIIQIAGAGADGVPRDFGLDRIGSHPLLGFFFRGVEVFEHEQGETRTHGFGRRARFVMNEFCKTRRPEDDKRGAEWIRTGE